MRHSDGLRRPWRRTVGPFPLEQIAPTSHATSSQNHLIAGNLSTEAFWQTERCWRQFTEATVRKDWKVLEKAEYSGFASTLSSSFGL